MTAAFVYSKNSHATGFWYAEIKVNAYTSGFPQAQHYGVITADLNASTSAYVNAAGNVAADGVSLSDWGLGEIVTGDTVMIALDMTTEPGVARVFLGLNGAWCLTGDVPSPSATNFYAQPTEQAVLVHARSIQEAAFIDAFDANLHGTEVQCETPPPATYTAWDNQ